MAVPPTIIGLVAYFNFQNSLLENTGDLTLLVIC